VFQLVPTSGGAWSLNTINILNGDSESAQHGGLLFDPSGNLFVTAPGLGEQVRGEAIELIPPQSGGKWTQITLHSFNGGGDAHPFGFVEDTLGNLYGTTEGNQNNACGEVFKLSNLAGAWNRVVLHSFSSKLFKQGCFPQASLVYGKWKALYGTTSQGGEKQCGYDGCGTVFGFLP
jgi:hypothetical protein